MSNKLKHCMCGCIYEENECPNCNKVSDKGRIKELEDKLAKAVEALDYCINAPFSGWTIAQGYACTILDEIKGE